MIKPTSLKNKLIFKINQIKSIITTVTCFKNPFIIILTRLGFIKLKYFPYSFKCNQKNIMMLGRPIAKEMADLLTIKTVFKYQEYYDILKYLPEKPLTILDVGANIGSFTIWLNCFKIVSKAYLFEPEIDNFRLLEFNLSQNKHLNYECINAALTGVSRTTKIRLKTDSPGGTNIYEDISSSLNNEFYNIRCIGLNDWISTVNSDFDILKLDCEGSEWEILKNTHKTAFNHFRLVVIEVHRDPASQYSINDFLTLVETKNFQTIRWDNKEYGIYIGVQKKSL